MTTTSAVLAPPVSVTGNDAVAFSGTVGEPAVTATVSVSSSVIVSVLSAGAATPFPPVTEPDTVTSLSGASTALSTAVKVTVPVLVVWPAAIVSVVPLCLKSPDTAGGTGVAETVTVATSPDAALRVAVTVLTPPFSLIEDGVSTRLTAGPTSSSVIVSVCGDGSDNPFPPEAKPETVTVLSGASTALSTAVNVTAPVLVVAPAAIVSVVPLCVKSPATAGETGVADTVTVTDSLDAALSVAVTVLTPPFSLIEDGVSTRLTAGPTSSSVIVSVCGDGSDTPFPPEADPETVTVLSGASTALSTAVNVTVPVLVVAPAAIVSVVPLCVKSPATAGETAVEDTVTVTDSLDAALSLAVTVLTPPLSLIEDGVSTRLTAGPTSSSVIVSVCGDGSDTPFPPEADPETVTVLSGASTALFTAVRVTVPVLVVAPAAIVSVVPLCLKSPETAGDTGDAEIVTPSPTRSTPRSASPSPCSHRRSR